MQPLAGRIGALILVEPIAVKDGKMNLAAHLPVKRIEHREGGARAVATAALVVAAGELELKVEESSGLPVAFTEIIRVRQCAE